MRRVYLIRHGKPDTHQRICLGQTDVPLGPLGRMQAGLLGEELGAKVSRVFSSPLVRSRETAQALGHPVTVLDDLKELSAGDWDGLSFEEIARCWPELYAARGDDPNLPIPGAEDAALGQRRFVSAVMDALARSEGDIAISAHISVIQLFLCHVLGISPYEARQFRIPCGSYCVVSYDGSFTVEAIGQLPSQSY